MIYSLKSGRGAAPYCVISLTLSYQVVPPSKYHVPKYQVAPIVDSAILCHLLTLKYQVSKYQNVLRIWIMKTNNAVPRAGKSAPYCTNVCLTSKYQVVARVRVQQQPTVPPAWVLRISTVPCSFKRGVHNTMLWY